MLLFSACGGSGTPAAGTATRPAVTPSQPATTPTSSLLSHPVVYVALGASDAVGVGASSPATQGYVPRIAARLPGGSRTVDLGISGIHLHEALTRELPAAISASPDLVTAWLVVNDFVSGVPYDSYMHDLNTLFEQLQTRTHARLVSANIPDLTLLPAFSRLTATQKTEMRLQIERWNAGIAALASQYDVTLVDLYGHNSQLTAHPEYVSADGFHPSAAGYAQLANYFWQAIEQ